MQTQSSVSPRPTDKLTDKFLYVFCLESNADVLFANDFDPFMCRRGMSSNQRNMLTMQLLIFGTVHVAA